MDIKKLEKGNELNYEIKRLKDAKANLSQAEVKQRIGFDDLLDEDELLTVQAIIEHAIDRQVQNHQNEFEKL